MIVIKKILIFILAFFMFFIYKTNDLNAKKSFNLLYPEFYYLDDGEYFIDTNDFNIYKDKSLLIKDSSETGFIKYGDSIFFINSKDNYLYRFDLQNKRVDKVSQNKVFKKYLNFFILNDKIFYYDYKNELRKIWNGRDLIALPFEANIANALFENRIIINNMILTWGQKGIYKIDLENYLISRLYDKEVYALQASGENIYFIDSDFNLVVMNFYGKISKKIKTDAVDFGADFNLGKLILNNGFLYLIDYSLNGNKLTRIDLKNYNKEIVLENVIDFYIKDTKLFVLSNIDGDNIKLIDLQNKKNILLPKDNYISLLSYNNNVLCVLVKSKNHENFLGELKFININEGPQLKD